MLAFLALQGIGPSSHLECDLAVRLNLFTGDNGLGKTFLLECAWWALAGEWAGLPAHPRSDASGTDARITAQLRGEPEYLVRYDWDNQVWPTVASHLPPGIVIYARVDGSFAVYDPMQRYLRAEPRSAIRELPAAFILSPDQLWNGYEIGEGVQARTVTNGLLRDVVQWQYNPGRYPFAVLEQVLRHLSPTEQSELTLGEPVRLPYDRRDIPTLRLPYGDVPVVYAAAGMRRILAMSYLIVWAWDEHSKQAALARRSPYHQITIMVDEIEAHLHPKWQRRILPALLDIQTALGTTAQIQYLVATHSPIIAASVEPYFDLQRDRLWHLDLMGSNGQGQEVTLQEVGFVRHGTIDAWLTADDVFGLASARSLEAEDAIKQAKLLQLKDEQVTTQEVEAVSVLLTRYLAAEDEFWPRWTYFAEQHGVQL